MSDNSKLLTSKKKGHGGLHYEIVTSVPKYNRSKINIIVKADK